MRSHSGGPLGPIILTIHSWDSRMLSFPASSAGPCWILLSHCLGIFSRGLVLLVLPTPTDSYHSHVVPIACYDYHGLFGSCSLIHSSRRPMPIVSTATLTIDLFIPRRQLCVGIHSRGYCPFRLDSTDYSRWFVLVLHGNIVRSGLLFSLTHSSRGLLSPLFAWLVVPNWTPTDS
jgi:hypothetical protein